MTSVVDVAEAILVEKGPMDIYRLHKLVYYAQAYHAVKTGQPLFADRIEGWRQGPAVPRLYVEHRGAHTVSSVNGDPRHLSPDERASVAKALEFYGGHSSTWLVAQTHLERPWQDSRKGLAPTDRGHQTITIKSLRDYYQSVFNDPVVEAALEQLEEGDEGLTADEIRARYTA